MGRAPSHKHANFLVSATRGHGCELCWTYASIAAVACAIACSALLQHILYLISLSVCIELDNDPRGEQNERLYLVCHAARGTHTVRGG